MLCGESSPDIHNGTNQLTYQLIAHILNTRMFNQCCTAWPGLIALFGGGGGCLLRLTISIMIVFCWLFCFYGVTMLKERLRGMSCSKIQRREESKMSLEPESKHNNDPLNFGRDQLLSITCCEDTQTFLLKALLISSYY